MSVHDVMTISDVLDPNFHSKAAEEGHLHSFAVTMILMIRAETQEAAREGAESMIDGMRNVDTGEAGHIEDGFLI